MPPPLKNGTSGGGGGSSDADDDKKNGSDVQGNAAAAVSTSNDNHAPQQQQHLGDQMDRILQLLNRRVRGEATNEQIENAVDQVLQDMNVSAPTAAAPPRRPPAPQYHAQEQQPVIHPDMENYDDDDNETKSRPAAAVDTKESSDDAEEKKEDSGKQVTFQDEATENGKKRKAETAAAAADAPKPKSRRGRKRIHPLPTPEELAYKDTLEQIPMGTMGAKMMTTFGDGPTPIPQALEAALLGTRKTLQVAIMDARKVRRRLQQDFFDAQSSVDPKLQKANQDRKRRAERAERLAKEKKKDKERNSDDDDDDDEGDKKLPAAKPKSDAVNNSLAVDPRLMFRALQDGNDKLAGQPKCGFHIEELEHLFPEEMKAYHRWIDMHEQYNESKSDDKEKLSETTGGDEEDENEEGVEDLPEGGYIKERLGVFDFRTDRMKKDWYLEFAKIRAGSFLPNTMRVRKSQAEKDWDAIRKKKGKHSGGTWENISGRSVRFLHWLGFDPPNLHPPDEETTQALAFLAYDRMGRIVEKAIYLRNLDAQQEKTQQFESEDKGEDAVGGRLWELPQGEQLSKADIDRAMEDPGIKPATVYGSEDASAQSSIQLYFGPGWEDRLELEMEEFIAATQGPTEKTQITDKEREFREQEAEMLQKISAPPTRGDDALQKLVEDRTGKAE